MDIKEIFAKSLAEHKKYTKQRIEIIVLSNEILRHAKQTIFALHREDFDKANKLLVANIKKIQDILKIIGKEKYLKHEIGAFTASCEEFLESVFFYGYKKGTDLGAIDLFVNDIGYDVYLGALCDYTGELTRDAYRQAGKNKLAYIENIQKIIDSVVLGMLEFDLTGKLRAKLEDAKRNLKKVEGIIYELRIRE